MGEQSTFRRGFPVKFALKVLLALAGVGLTAMIVAANFTHDPDFFNYRWKLNSEPPLEVKLAPVAPSNITRTVEAPGKVEADVEVKISSQIMGRIVKLGQKEKGALKEGDR